VVPDLDTPGLTAVISDWVREAPPVVAAALLEAAKTEDEVRPSGGKAFQLVARASGDAALQKLLELSGIQFDWPYQPPRARPSAHRAESRPRGKILGRFRATQEP
jgi:hypothetical protein